MKRKIDAILDQWAQLEDAAPLLIRGARRTGKTYCMKRLGMDRFGKNRFAYLDFQTDLDRLAPIFSNTGDVENIVRGLSAYLNMNIVPHETLIAFDEIQLCEEAMNSLRFFAGTGYKVLSSGSQLGITLRNRTLPFPSDIKQVQLHPLDFEEWLWANDHTKMAEAIRNQYESHDAFSLHEMAMDYYRLYTVTGGLPAAVRAYAEGEGLPEVREILTSIDQTYTADIALYAPPETVVNTQSVWQSVPRQLARETSRKFKYSDIKKGGRQRQYALPLAWLEAAELITLNEQTNDFTAPLMARDGGAFFKVYMADTGLLYHRYGLDASAWLTEEGRNRLSPRFKGALTENYAMQALTANAIPTFYWTSADGQYEVEFLIQTPFGEVVPIEIKSGTNVRATSMRRFMEKSESPYAIRASMKNFGLENRIMSVPLYAMFCIEAH